MSRTKHLPALGGLAAVVVAVGSSALVAAPAFANTTGTGLVISEAYVNGGSAGASYLNKFVELYNPTSTAIDLAGDTLQYRAPTSSVTPSGSQVFALSGTVAAHSHFLIQLPSNGAVGAALPAADLSTGSAINPGAGGGTLFIAASTTGVVPTDASVIDKLGWGTSNSPEGTAASGNSVVLSYQRAADGADTDVNSADFAVAAPTPQNAASDDTATGVVIDEVYGGGGNSGSHFSADFIELYNRGAAAVDLSGWSVQYRSATGTSAQVTNLSGSIAGHGRYLVAEAAGTGGDQIALPTPDASGSIPMSASSGVVILSDGTTGIAATGELHGVDHVIDAVGFGTSATSFETAHTSANLSASLAASRTNGIDTDDNSADFTTGAPTPVNSAGETGAEEPGDGGTTPGDGGTTPTTVTIAQIQGTNTDTSPLAGQTVTTEGVVTAVYATGGFNGFYLQTGGTGAGTDATPGASDAVFVYGSISAGLVRIGESVRVTGTVSEYQGATELSSPTVTELTTALPAVTPAALPWSDLDTEAEKEAHVGELIAPQGDFIVSDVYNANYYGSFTLAAGTTPLRQPTDVGTAGSAAAQAVEADNAARLITLDDGQSTNYGTTSSAAADTPLPWLTADHAVTDGAEVAFHQGVILEYRFSLWNFQPTAPIVGDGHDVATFGDVRATNEAGPQDVGGNLRIGTFNVENFFPTTGEEFVADFAGSSCSYYTDHDGAKTGTVNTCTFADGSAGPRGAANDAAYQRQLAKIVTGINRLGASIVSLEEIENSVKFGKDRDDALGQLVDALNTAAGADVWAFAPSPAAAGLPALDEQDVIRTAFIYKPADVELVGDSVVLTDLSQDGEPFSIAREPDAQAFKKLGAQDADAFLVVANHWKSKGSGTALYPGDVEDTTSLAVDQGAFNETRVHEAEAVVDWADDVAASIGTDRIFLVGDFNSYTHEDPMETLYAAGYTDLNSALNESEPTYAYKTLQGSLDHVLANPAALELVTGADVWQINAQEAIAYAYSRYNYNATPLFDGTDPFAASDHDPVVFGIDGPDTTPAGGGNGNGDGGGNGGSGDGGQGGGNGGDGNGGGNAGQPGGGQPGHGGAHPTVTLGAGTVVRGGSLHLHIAGLTPFGHYLVILHSDPVTLAAATADANGTLDLVATIPADTAAGAHTIQVVAADDPDTVLASAALTVTAAALSSTGTDLLPTVGAAALFLLLGLGLVAGPRLLRRRTE